MQNKKQDKETEDTGKETKTGQRKQTMSEQESIAVKKKLLHPVENVLENKRVNLN